MIDQKLVVWKLNGERGDVENDYSRKILIEVTGPVTLRIRTLFLGNEDHEPQNSVTAYCETSELTLGLRQWTFTACTDLKLSVSLILLL
jgi:hypothetical protein